MKALATIAAFGAANYIWEFLLGRRDYEIAFQRSFFQTVAILTYVFVR